MGWYFIWNTNFVMVTITIEKNNEDLDKVKDEGVGEDS